MKGAGARPVALLLGRKEPEPAAVRGESRGSAVSGRGAGAPGSLGDGPEPRAHSGVHQGRRGGLASETAGDGSTCLSGGRGPEEGLLVCRAGPGWLLLCVGVLSLSRHVSREGSRRRRCLLQFFVVTRHRWSLNRWSWLCPKWSLPLAPSLAQVLPFLHTGVRFTDRSSACPVITELQESTENDVCPHRAAWPGLGGHVRLPEQTQCPRRTGTAWRTGASGGRGHGRGLA